MMTIEKPVKLDERSALEILLSAAYHCVHDGASVYSAMDEQRRASVVGLMQKMARLLPTDYDAEAFVADVLDKKHAWFEREAILKAKLDQYWAIFMKRKYG